MIWTLIESSCQGSWHPQGPIRTSVMACGWLLWKAFRQCFRKDFIPTLWSLLEKQTPWHLSFSSCSTLRVTIDAHANTHILHSIVERWQTFAKRNGRSLGIEAKVKAVWSVSFLPSYMHDWFVLNETHQQGQHQQGQVNCLKWKVLFFHCHCQCIVCIARQEPIHCCPPRLMDFLLPYSKLEKRGWCFTVGTMIGPHPCLMHVCLLLVLCMVHR